MRKNIMMRLATAALSISLMGIPSTIPAYAGTVDAIFKTGGVQISLEQKMLDDNGKRVDPYEVNLTPTQEVSYIVSIKNELSPSYIRVKVIYSGEFDGVDDTMLQGVSDDWVKRGDYWYYKNIVETGSLTDFCTGLKMPNFKESTGVPVSVNVDADAVQAANFTPNFTSETPWGDVEVESHASFNDSVREDSGDSGFHIKFQDLQNGEMNESDDLFKNFHSLMPGDVVSETLTIKNEYERPIAVRLQADNSNVDDSINEWVHVKIQRLKTEAVSEKTIYEGPLYGDGLTDVLVMGVIGVEQSHKFKITLSVDKDMPNSTMMQDYPVSWSIWSTNKTDGGSENGYSGNGNGGSNGVNNQETQAATNQTVNNGGNTYSGDLSSSLGDITANYRSTAKDSNGNSLTSGDTSLKGKDGLQYSFKDGADSMSGKNGGAGNYKTGDVFPFAVLGGVSILGFIGFALSGRKKKEEENA